MLRMIGNFTKGPFLREVVIRSVYAGCLRANRYGPTKLILRNDFKSPGVLAYDLPVVDKCV